MYQVRSMKTFASSSLGLLLLASIGCSEPPTPTADTKSSASAATAKTTATTPQASAKPTAEATVTATATATAATSASASASASAAALFPSEAPSAEPPSDEEFQKLDKEINVRASGEQKCTTKVLRGWFELACGPADGLVRATKVEVLSGFDAAKAITETPTKGESLRWLAPLPATGEKSQARMTGAKLHEIFITLENTDKGWKGQLSGKRPE
jgi:hypothetical protein